MTVSVLKVLTAAQLPTANASKTKDHLNTLAYICSARVSRTSMLQDACPYILLHHLDTNADLQHANSHGHHQLANGVGKHTSIQQRGCLL